jgi:hypothetical protein
MKKKTMVLAAVLLILLFTPGIVWAQTVACYVGPESQRFKTARMTILFGVQNQIEGNDATGNYTIDIPFIIPFPTTGISNTVTADSTILPGEGVEVFKTSLETEINGDIQTLLATASPQDIRTLCILINTNNLADIIINNTHLLDLTTADYINNLEVSQLIIELNNIIVAMGIDKDAAHAMTINHGVSLSDDMEAFAAGNTIIVFGHMLTDSKGRIIDHGDASLLAHESIHSLQVNARYSIKAFIDEYNSTSSQYPAGPLEQAAYNFGPYNQDAINAGSLNPPVLYEKNNQEWFK